MRGEETAPQPEGERMKRQRLRVLRLPVLGALALAVGACHHVIIDGGLEPSEIRYDEEWNLAFAGAIYPANVDASDRCGGYYSRVETRQSFLNLVVAAWTVGWINPMQARLDCGAPTGGNAADGDAPDEDAAGGEGRAAGVADMVGKEANGAR